MWLASEAMFFGGLFAAWFFVRGQSDVWPPEGVHLDTPRTLVALYTTSLLRWSEESGIVHAGVHAHVLASGFLFCWTAVGVDPGPRRLPHPARVLFVLLAVPFHAIVAISMIGDADRTAGAAILWGTGEVFGLVLTGIAVARWMAADDREAARSDPSAGGAVRR